MNQKNSSALCLTIKQFLLININKFSKILLIINSKLSSNYYFKLHKKY